MAGGGLSGPARAPRHKPRKGNQGKIDLTPQQRAGGQSEAKIAETTDLLLDLQVSKRHKLKYTFFSLQYRLTIPTNIHVCTLCTCALCTCTCTYMYILCIRTNMLLCTHSSVQYNTCMYICILSYYMYIVHVHVHCTCTCTSKLDITGSNPTQDSSASN